MPLHSGAQSDQARVPPAYVAAEAAAVMEGRVVWGNPAVKFHGAAFDSRHVAPGQLFFATPGERTDGHLYLGAAAERGACCFLVSRWDVELETQLLGALGRAGRGPETPAGGYAAAVIKADDTVAAIGRLAAHHRSRFSLPVIGITGSVGKTTAKDMCAHILERRLDVLSTQGNLNSDISLPVVLLRLDAVHRAAVLEMATRGPGQLAYLAALALPAVGVVTTVAPVHVETLGSVAGVAKAKVELLRALPPNGVAVYNSDSPELRAELAVGGVRAQIVGFGFERATDVRAEEASTTFKRDGDRIEPSLSFSVTCRPGPAADRLALPTGCTLHAAIPYPGRHNVLNALAAALAAAAAGVPFADGLDALGRFRPRSAMRLDIQVVGERVLIDDAYNANLASMLAALEILATVPAAGRRIAVLADMLELGPLEAEQHLELGRRVPAAGVDLLVCVGPAMRIAAESALGAGMSGRTVFWAADRATAADYVLHQARPGDAVLVKGSRGMAMEHVVQVLRQGWLA